MHTLNVLNHLLFNSHPHMEDDRTTLSVFNTSNFSTHILTRRMTKDCVTQVYKYDFSTHILTRRMTKDCVTQVYKYDFSTHILTRRMT